MFLRILALLKKEFLLEYREQHAFWAAMLYLVAVMYVVYRVFGTMTGLTWVALFWIILLFTALNIVMGSFGGTLRRRLLYYYSLYDPLEYFFAKMIFAWFKILMAGGLLILLFYIFYGKTLEDPLLFAITLLLSGFGFSVNLIFISALTSLGSGQSTLIAILSLPVLIPVLLLAMKVSSVAAGLIFDSNARADLLWLGGIDLMAVGVALFLMPYLWKS